MKKSKVRGAAKQAGIRFEPILGYCSDTISQLNKEDSSRLTEKLLTILNDLRPHLKAGKKASPLIVELLDWDGIRNTETRNLKDSSTKSSAKMSDHRR